MSEEPQVLFDFVSGKATPLKWEVSGKTIEFRGQQHPGGVNVITAVVDDDERELADCSIPDSDGKVGRAELMIRRNSDPDIRVLLHVICVIEGDKTHTNGTGWYVDQTSEKLELLIGDRYEKEGLYYAPLVDHGDKLLLQTLTSYRRETCGIRKDGSSICWGKSGRHEPAQGAQLTMLDINAGVSCGIKKDKSIVCWNDSGPILGIGKIKIPKGSFVDIAVGHSQMCTIDVAGASKCWWTDPPKKSKSENIADAVVDVATQLGHYDIEVPAGDFTDIEAQYSITCGLLKNGAVKCWGDSDDNLVAEVPKGEFTQLALYTDNACALSKDGTLSCWGALADDGQKAPAGRFKHVDVGEHHACAISEDSKLQCWGDNEAGVIDVPKGSFRMVSVGSNFACAIGTDDTVECWGQTGTDDATRPPIF